MPVYATNGNPRDQLMSIWYNTQGVVGNRELLAGAGFAPVLASDTPLAATDLMINFVAEAEASHHDNVKASVRADGMGLVRLANPFFDTDFYSYLDVAGAGTGISTSNAPWYGQAINGGGMGAGIGSGGNLMNHPGTTRIRSANPGATNSGYRWSTHGGLFIPASSTEPSLMYGCVFAVLTSTNNSAVFGLPDSVWPTTPTNGVYCSLSGTTLRQQRWLLVHQLRYGPKLLVLIHGIHLRFLFLEGIALVANCGMMLELPLLQELALTTLVQLPWKVQSRLFLQPLHLMLT